MSDTKYAYAVARIRALENGLFSSAQIEQLLSVKSYEGALRFLTEHGWGDADTPLSAEAILTREKTKTWETVRDLLKGDPGSAFLRGSLPQFKGGDQGCGGAGQPWQCLF